jgi:hypothetical protein
MIEEQQGELDSAPADSVNGPGGPEKQGIHVRRAEENESAAPQARADAAHDFAGTIKVLDDIPERNDIVFPIASQLGFHDGRVFDPFRADIPELAGDAAGGCRGINSEGFESRLSSGPQESSR